MSRKKSLDLGPVLQEQIRRSASELFDARGYSGASIRDIADAVGISSSTMYHYFPNKQAILGEILINFMISYNSVVLPVLRHPDHEPAEKIANLVDVTIRMGDDHRSELRFGKPLRYALDQEMTATVVGMQREVNNALRDVIDEGLDQGVFTVDDASIATMAILDMINGVREWYKPDGRVCLDDLVSQYSDQCLRLLSDSRSRN